MRVLTHSRLASYRACPLKHFYAYVTGKRAVKTALALLIGTIVHKCLEAYWRARMEGMEASERAAHAIAQIPTDFDEFEVAKMRGMLACYMALWDGIQCQVLAVEVQFRMPLVNPANGTVAQTWEMGGKIDAIIRLADGRVAVLEHKTTSDEAKPGGSYRQRLKIDGQITQYMLGARALGYDPTHVVYDVLKKPKKKPLKATPVNKRVYKKDGNLRKGQREFDETPLQYAERISREMSKNPEAYLVRVDVPRLDSDMKAYEFDVWSWADAMSRSERTSVAPKNPDSCWKYNSPCEFWDVCDGLCSINDPSRYRDTTSENEELQEPVHVEV